MAFPKNETHNHISEKKARQAAEAAGLTAADLKFYRSGMLWGWIAKAAAETPAAADRPPVVAHVPQTMVDAFGMQGFVKAGFVVVDPPVDTETACEECGEAAFVDNDGVSHHAGDTFDGVDHDADADHVALVAEEPFRPVAAAVGDLGAAVAHVKEEIIGAAASASSNQGMVILDIAGFHSPAEGARLARLIAARTGQPVTRRLAANNDVLDQIEPPERVWSYVDEKGRERFPSDLQFTFITLCTRPEGATSAQLKAAIQSPNDKVTKNWIVIGEAVEKFGFRFDFEFRKINRLSSEKVFRLYPAEAAAA